MLSINKVIVVGTCSDDPEIRTFPNGKQVANFCLCTEETWLDKTTGKKKVAVQFHRVAVFSDHLVKYMLAAPARKGTLMMIEGQLETRNYTDAQGVDRNTTDIVIRPHKGNLIVLEPANSNNHEAIIKDDAKPETW